MSDMNTTLDVAAAGLRAQTARMRIIAENLANANSTAQTPGGDPYRRRIPTFSSMVDRETGATMVKMNGAKPAQGDFARRFDPANPAADAAGYVKTPNVNSLIEMMDMREAQRAYEANLNVVESARAMLTRTIDLLRR
jgi:flagellar basal-body rod protein FlgC